jgi:mannitol/fructose-specific phosphotransferase system IIA component (Ntr-type)
MAIAPADLLDDKQVSLHLRARTKVGAFREIVQLFAENDRIAKPEVFLKELLARQEIHASTVERQVAFAHLRTDLVDEIVLGIGRSDASIPFGNGQRARLIFLIGVPQRLANEYLICVGAFVRVLRDDKIRAALLRAKMPAQFADLLRQAL